MRAGRGEAELGVERREERLGHLLVDPHCAITLHVGVAAYGAHSGAGAPDIALQEEQVHHVAQRRDRMLVLRQTHRPAHDRRGRCDHQVADFPHLCLAEPRRGLELGPGCRLQAIGVGGEVARVLRQEVGVEDAGLAGLDAPVVLLEQVLAERLEQRLIAAHADLDELVGDRGAVTDDAAGGLRVLEPHETRLGERVDRDDRGALEFGLLECTEHPGVVGRRVLSRDDDEARVVDVLDGDGAFADPERLRERDAAGLVAHVRAVGQVVRAEPPHQELVEECGLVRGATRRVEDRLVGALQGAQLVGDEVEGLVPARRAVVRRALVEDHRFHETSLLAEPVVVVLEQVGDRMLREELPRHPAHGCFFGHGLRAVLAELGDVSLVFFGPRASRAVEPVLLVHAQQRAGAAHDAHLLQRHPERVHHGGHPDRLGRRRRDAHLRLVDVCSGGGLCHGEFSGWTLRREWPRGRCRRRSTRTPVHADLS